MRDAILRNLFILYTTLELATTAIQAKHWIEEHHQEDRERQDNIVNGTEIPDPWTQTPDFRMEEGKWFAFKEHFYKEMHRPYRISPFYKSIYKWSKSWGPTKEDPWGLGCYCTTVYKRLTVLAGCAVITSRHILTTATSTELVLQHYRGHRTVENILGAWYDHDADTFNSSMYMTPARIHYHPKFTWPHTANVTHPLPFLFDLAIWAGTIKFIGNYWSSIKAAICPRGGPHWWQSLSSTPRWWDLAHIVGFQYIKSQRKRPMPWFKYVVRTRQHMEMCPKTEWSWFHCLTGGDSWSRYGLESGAAWHRQLEKRYWIYDGLIGLCAFTMKLRSDVPIHYFTVLNTHINMNFMFNAYRGRMPYQFLDYRFYDTKGRSPIRRPWAMIFHNYPLGEEHYKNEPIPWY